LAIEDFDESLKFKPESASTHCWRGAAYYKQVRCDLAVADFTEAIQLKPDSASYYNRRGDAYHRQFLYDLAIEDYNKAIKLDPNNYFCAPCAIIKLALAAPSAAERKRNPQWPYRRRLAGERAEQSGS